MNEYMSNSNKSREDGDTKEEHKITKIVSGNVRSRKSGGVSKFVDSFINEDLNSIKSYIVEDVIVPSIKKTIIDIVTNGVRMIFGESPGKSKENTSKISYRSYYDEPIRRPSARRLYDYNDIIIDNCGEAEDVLRTLDELIEKYKIVSVADFYDLVGVSGNYTDNKYGWNDLRNAKIVRVRDGYMIKLPPVIPLD